MATVKDFKQAEKHVLRQQQCIGELESLAKDIERCEKIITDLKAELGSVNEKHANRKTTREDIAYLTDLLKCANKKLAWEQKVASLQKRTPAVLEEMTALMTDEKFPPAEETRASMLKVLQGLQAAMERLQGVKVE
jgi:predicted RNase H-like nuclease (RuvC/YqgF family)